MEQVPPSLATRVVKLAIKAGVSVVALLMLRGIVGSLPMLKNSPAISDTFLGDTLLSPLLIANAIIDSAILAVILVFGIRLGHLVRVQGERFAELGSIVTQATLVVILILAYKMYELPAACFFVGRTDLVNLNTSNPSAAYGDFIRAWGQLINQANATIIQNASGEALNSYQQLALAVFRRPPNYYAWAFLILIAIPIIGLVPLVHRNLDTMADLLSHGAALLQGTSHPIAAGPAPPTTSPGTSQPEPHVEAPQQMPLKVVVEKLIKLKTLLDSGAISTADFQSQKQRVLGLPIALTATNLDPDDFIKLKALFEAGALTEAEYETQKQKALQMI